MSKPLQLGLVGFGKIARDQHLPAIAALPGSELVAIASRNAEAEGVANYTSLEALLAGEPGLDAVILCQPPQARYDAARMALLAGKHVFLEKPPRATVSEVEALVDLARARSVTLFASWHSRHAAGVAAAKAWLAGRALTSARIAWKEDIRVWHPGQDWILQAGGFGVFDPGINALSILTEIVPERVRLIDATLAIPAKRHAPIAAALSLATASGVPIAAAFDFLQTGPQSWDIAVETDRGPLLLAHGGNALTIDGARVALEPEGEYPALYRRFAALIADGVSDVDTAPLQIVADAFLRGEITRTEAFDY